MYILSRNSHGSWKFTSFSVLDTVLHFSSSTHITKELVVLSHHWPSTDFKIELNNTWPELTEEHSVITTSTWLALVLDPGSVLLASIKYFDRRVQFPITDSRWEVLARYCTPPVQYWIRINYRLFSTTTSTSEP